MIQIRWADLRFRDLMLAYGIQAKNVKSGRYRGANPDNIELVFCNLESLRPGDDPNLKKTACCWSSWVCPHVFHYP